MFVIARPAVAQVLYYASTTMGAPNQTGGLSVFSDQFPSVRFDVASTATITAVGGHFKGSPGLGGRNYEEERNALDRVDQAFDQLREERRKGPKSNAEKLKELGYRFPIEPNLNDASNGDNFIAVHESKYASGAEPGARVKDLYEVCGQAVRSAG